MIIQLLNGTQIDIKDYGLTRLFHRISALELEEYSESIEARDGEVEGLGVRYSNRNISVDFLYQVADIYDFYILRDKISDLFTRKEDFYIIFKREPYKRWKVRRLSSFTLEPNPKAEVFTVEFKCVNYYSESIATTSDIKEWDVDKWGWDGSIDWDEPLQYRFNSNSFVVKNLGNVHIDPREHPLNITIKAQTSSFFRLYNRTTGDTYILNTGLNYSDTLVLSGVRSLLNGISVFGNTNHSLITLAPGDNVFEVEGGVLNDAYFDFRFLSK